MTTRENLINYVKRFRNKGYERPIFEIFVMENKDKELIYHKEGKDINSGFPDEGASRNWGFYYDLDDAINAMHTNSTDMREYLYNAGFIFCRFPGIGCVCTTEERMYFVWDDEKGGFYEAEEPEIFKHVAY